MKRIDFVLFLALIFGVMVLSILSIWGWYQFVDGTLFMRPIEFETTILKTTKDGYQPGELVQGKLRYLKNRAVIEKVQWSLVSTVLIEFAPKVVALPVGQYDFLVDIAKIPESLPAAQSDVKWKFTGIVEVPVNPFRSVFYHIETSEFVINSP